MSDFFRRASDALYHRPRQGSADSTDAPKSPDAVNQSEQDMLNHQVGLNQSGSRINDNVAGEAAGSDAHPKEHRYWVWGHHQQNKPMTKQEPDNQDRKVDTDWILGT